MDSQSRTLSPGSQSWELYLATYHFRSRIGGIEYIGDGPILAKQCGMGESRAYGEGVRNL